MRVLLAEDDPLLGQALKVALEQEGLAVEWAADGVEAYAAFQRDGFSALLLDLELPGLNGLDMLHRVRQSDWQLPVIIITAHGQSADRVRGLDFGADDYLSKPFDVDELLARLRALMRRSRGTPGARLRTGSVELDLRDHTVTRAGEPVWLSAREFSVLRLLMESAGAAVPRQRIEAHLQGWGDEIEGNLVEVYVYNLRKKLGRDFIQTYRGSGYSVAP